MIWFAHSVGFLFLFVRVAIVVKNTVRHPAEKLVIPQNKRSGIKGMHPRRMPVLITVIAINYTESTVVKVRP